MARTIAVICAAFLLAAPAGFAQKKGPKVFVSADMEGIWGVLHTNQTSADSPEYAAGRRWMVEDINAVIDGLFDAGAGEIVVNDSHASMRNIQPDALNPKASLISGSPKPLSMMQGIDASCEAVVLGGSHSRAGTAAAIMDDTISGATIRGMAARAGVTPEEAAALGTTLTPVGAEMAGDAAGTIPAFTGALAPPASFQPGDGRRPDPFADEKPLRAVTAANMAESESQLTAGARELLRKYPGFRMDVYPTHRTVGWPDYLVANTRRNAVEAHTSDNGIHLHKVLPGVPFPIPREGREVMWNHRLHYMGRAVLFKYEGWLVDSAGQRVHASTALSRWEFPVFDPKRTEPLQPDEPLFLWRLDYTVAPRC